MQFTEDIYKYTFYSYKMFSVPHEITKKIFINQAVRLFVRPFVRPSKLALKAIQGNKVMTSAMLLDLLENSSI